MAIIINPDGTVSTIETTHDQYGNIRPKIDSEVMKEQEIHYNKNTISETKGKKGYVYPTSSDSGKNNSGYIPVKRKISVTTAQVDRFFNKLISAGKFLGFNKYQSIKNRLPQYIQTYFASKYESYIEKIRGFEEAMKRTTFKPKSEVICTQNHKNT